MKLSAEQITVFVASIAIMLFFGRLLGEIFSKVKQAPIMGEILAGIILGPTVFGYFFPDAFNFIFPKNSEISVALDGISNLAVIMLLLVSGLEVDLSLIIKSGKTALYTSFLGMIFPFLIGLGLSILFYDNFHAGGNDKKLFFALFIGTAMSISALPVIARTLMDLKLIKSKIGMIILASAMFNDLVGWIIFSALLDMMRSSGHSSNIFIKLISVLGFVLFMLLVVRKLINMVLPYLQTKLTYPGAVLNFIFIIGFISAAFTEWLGIHAIFGSFILGVAIGDTPALKENTREIIHQFVTNIFAPIFFVSIGLKINIITHFDWFSVLFILLIAFTGKVIGAGYGSYLGGMRKNEAMVIGFGMNSRGAMEIIIGLLALQMKIIPEHIFVAIVIMAVLTSLSSAPFMNFFMRYGRRDSLKSLLNKNIVVSLTSSDKNAVIEQLVKLLIKKDEMQQKRIYNEVLAREALIPTGMGHGLALPHAKVDIDEPMLAIGLSKSGIDFEAPDNQPAKIIMLLLVPKSENELQLKLMAEIAQKFKDKEMAVQYTSAENGVQFLKLFGHSAENKGLVNQS